MALVLNPINMIHGLMEQHIDPLGVFDSFYICILGGLLGFTSPMISSLLNVFNQTDEV